MGSSVGTSFVGRATELDAIERHLAERRLVTIVGEGGVGKTRLAREAFDAHASAGCVSFWIDLGAASTAQGVDASFEDALRPNRGDLSFEGLVTERVPTERCLLTIDNCEHVLDEIAHRIATIRRLRPDARILATSRTRLGSSDEVVVRLDPLPVPEPEAGLPSVADTAAVTLLVDRVRDVVADFELGSANVGDVVTLAERTEGVPLAIELVAAAAGALPLPEIVRSVVELGDLDVVDSRREPRRHRSLDASVRWSTGRLGDEAKVALRRLGVFADSFCFESAVRVVSDDGDPVDRAAVRAVTELIEVSLVRRIGDDRFSLPMAVRTYAQDELTADPSCIDVHDRHADVVTDVVTDAMARLRAEDEREAWLELLDLELGETRAAVDWFLRRGKPERAAALLVSTEEHAHVRGRYGEMLAQCRRVLAAPGLRPSEAANLTSVAAIISLMAGRLSDSFDLATQALEYASDPVSRAHAHYQRSWCGFFSGRSTAASMWADLDEGLRLAELIDDPELRRVFDVRRGALGLHNRSIPEGRAALAAAEPMGRIAWSHPLSARLFEVYGVAVFDLDLDDSFPKLVRLIDDCRRDGHVAFLSMALSTAGAVTALRGDHPGAERYIAEAEQITERYELATFRNLTQRWRSFVHYRFDLPDTVEQAQRAITLAEVTDNAWDTAAGHWLTGLAMMRVGDQRARVHLETAEEMSREPGYPFSAIRAALALALLDLADDDFRAAVERVHDALRAAHDCGDLFGIAAGLDHLAYVESLRSANERAGRFAGAADAIYERAGIERLPCERDLRELVAQRLDDESESAAAALVEGRALSPDDAVRLARRSRGRRARPVTGWSSLTPTERQVADLAAGGLTNQAIASQLLMSPNTVKTHLSHVYAKVGVSGRSGLAAARLARSSKP